MMPRPRGGDWLEDEMLVLRQMGVSTLLSLLTYPERVELQLDRQWHWCEKYHINYLNYRIPDCEVPERFYDYHYHVLWLDRALKAGNKTVVHCRMGIGRTSMLVAGVMLLNGADPDTVFDRISAARTLSVPDTAEQRAWVLRHAGQIRYPEKRG
ncbi:MAG: tyrosine protein phosphatase [Bacteroidota bacterium]